MKWLSAGLTFVNVATVWGLLGGFASHGLNRTVAVSSMIAGLLAALLAFWGTRAGTPPETGAAHPTPAEPTPTRRLFQRYRSVWLWVVVGLFAIFAIRSFCNVLFIDGNELKIQSPNNLGDLSLHLTYIRNFASGVPLWPDNPIYVFSKLRYPAGIDLFNALLVSMGVDVIRGLVWAGLLASAATCFALFRWGGTFTIAGFLFNGGLVGFQWFRNYDWNDYQGVPFIAWKSLALSMFVTQRGLLYALPVGLILLYHWRAKFFAPNPAVITPAPSSAEPGAVEIAAPRSRPPLPFWVEISLYATLPLFHVHTFMALSVVLLFLFFFLDNRARLQLLLLAGASVIPATFFVWLITDHFHAGSVLTWNPGWVLNNGDFARPLAAFAAQPSPATTAVTGFFGTLGHFVQFWLINFGLTIPLIIALLVLLVIRAWKQRDETHPVKVPLVFIMAAIALGAVILASVFSYFSFGYGLFVALALIPPVVIAVLIPVSAALLQRNWKQTIPVSAAFAFTIPAVALFVFACLVKTAPWEWDNIKLIIWAYLIVLPFVWSEVVSRWVFPVRAVVCLVLFGSGFVTLFGGLAAGKTGFGLADRTELDAVAVAINKLPADARYAAYPTFNHPLLLLGRKVILGYPGHVWTQGFNYGDDANKLTALMNGAPGWKKTADDFHARYLFWGREEIRNYAASKRPWEQESKQVATGPWGSIYDLETPKNAAPSAGPSPALTLAPNPAASVAPSPAPSPTPAQ